MRFQVNPNSGVPLYRQLVNEVKTGFLRGFLRPGQRLPSVREVARELGLNPTTVVKAYDLLEHERLIVRRQGQGAFVTGGLQPLLPKERDSLVADLARALAVEGRRLGLSESQLHEALREQLSAIRPRKVPLP